MNELSGMLAKFALGPINGAAALAMMRLSLLDWTACAIAGVGEPVAQQMRGLAALEGGAPVATMAGSGTRVPARMAAMVNGATSHALDYDDTHFAHIGHPSVAVIPAALAIAEQTGANGNAFLQAALAGVEGSIRVGVWLGRSHYQAGFHQTATAGAFGATMAASRLLGLTHAQSVQALGLVSTRASGLKSQFGTMGKPLNAGIAAANGVEAALLAGSGFIANPDGMDTAQGFGPTHHGEGRMQAFDGLGREWLFEAISHKFHACCHGLHAMLNALSDVDVAPADVAAVAIRTHPRWLSVCNIAEPTSGLEAKFSYRLTAAMALCGVNTGAVASFTDAAACDPAMTRLRDRVRVIADPELSETQTRVEVTLLSGDRIERAHDLAAPISLADRGAKLRGKAASLLGASRSEKVARAVEADDLAALLAELAELAG